MSETETVPAVSTSEAVALPYDEALLIKDSKGKVKKPVKPDDTERNMQIEKLQEQITKHSDRIRDIKEVVDSKRGSARSVSGGGRDIVKRLQDLRNQFQSVLRQKQHIREELNDVNKARDDMRAQLRSIKDKTNQTRVEDVDAKIAELEDRLRHDSTLTIQDEKKLHDQITKLNANKPLVREHAALTLKLQETEGVRTQIIDRLKECDVVLGGIKSKEVEERAALDAIKSAESQETSDVPTLNVEKQECYQIIVSLREKITQIREEYSGRYLEWVKLDKVYNAYTRHIKKLQYEERLKEREERDTQKKVVVAANMPPPFENEMTAYLKRLQGSQEESVSTEAAVDLQAPAPGMMLLKKKGDDALESLFAGSGTKKGKGAKKASKDSSKVPKKGKLVHDIDTLKAFMLLKVDVPQTTAEVGKTLEAVAASKADFLKQREAQKNAPPPVKAPAQNGAAAATLNGGTAEDAGEGTPEPAAEGAAEERAEASAAEAGTDEAQSSADNAAAAAAKVEASATEAAAADTVPAVARDVALDKVAAAPKEADAAGAAEAKAVASHHVSDEGGEAGEGNEAVVAEVVPLAAAATAKGAAAADVKELARGVSVTLSVTDDSEEVEMAIKVTDA